MSEKTEVGRSLQYLIPSRAIQTGRIEEKRDKILNWLAEETFTTSKVLERLLGLKKNAVHKTLIAMQRVGMVDVHEVSYLDMRFRFIALTSHGAALVGRVGTHYQPGRIAESIIAHQLDVQMVRMQAEEIGWTGWICERALRVAAEQEKRTTTEPERLWLKVPDAVGSPPGQGAVAIEIERTIKTLKTYEVIVGQYLQMVKRGAVERVVYLTRTERIADALGATFNRIQTVPIGGKRFELSPEHHARFSFYAMSSASDWAGARQLTNVADT